MYLLSSFRHRRVRESAQSASQAAAAVPHSGFTFVDNSQGASAAISELSKALDFALEQIDLEGDLHAQLRAQLGRLDTEAAKHRNSSLDYCESATQWDWQVINPGSQSNTTLTDDSTRDEAELISIAWKCTVSVYDQSSGIISDGSDFKTVRSIQPSIGGGIKATAFSVITRDASNERVNPILPLLVVAVRGSASNVDHMVNANGTPRPAAQLFDQEMIRPDLRFWVNSLKAHSGFLNCASRLLKDVSTCIEDVTKSMAPKRVLFTGHSAGGAVASLIFLALRTHSAEKYRQMRFSCITFGSPPVAALDSSEHSFQVLQASDGSIVLDLINEFDLVTRTDRSYISSLVDFYRWIYNQPPLTNICKDHNKMSARELQTSTNAPESTTESTSQASDNVSWPLPPAELSHIGQRVILKMSLPTTSANEMNGVNVADDLTLSAWRVSTKDFEKLLFCRVAVHHKVLYQERIERLAKGCFNGRNGWPSVSAMLVGQAQQGTGSGNKHNDDEHEDRK